MPIQRDEDDRDTGFCKTAQAEKWIGHVCKDAEETLILLEKEKVIAR